MNDSSKKQEQELKDQSEKERQGLENTSKVAKSFKQDSQAELAELERQRSQAAAAVPGIALAIFERVAQHHEGEALATVVQSHPRRQEYICNGCNMNVTLEQYLALQTRDEIQQCNTCGRVLVLDRQSA